MKALIFMIADAHCDDGYRLHLVKAGDEWSVNYYSTMETSLLLQVVDIQMPKTSKLVELGMMKVEEMKEELTRSINDSTTRIKEFESKFMLLENIEEKI